jgi:hypothetical protein
VWTIDDENGKNLSWSGSLIENNKVSTWAYFSLGFKLDKKLANKNNVLNIYVWNPSKDEVWIDDFNFNLFDIYYEKNNDSNVNLNFYANEGVKSDSNTFEPLPFIVLHIMHVGFFDFSILNFCN